MNPDKKEHLAACVMRLSNLQTTKYIAGQKEHGGKMWLKTGLLQAAMEEIADLANYLPTIEQQIQKAILFLETDEPMKAHTILTGLLSKKIEMPLV